MIKDFIKNNPPRISAGKVASSIKLSYQHLKKARNNAATLVTMVESSKLIFSPVAVSIAVMLVATFVTIL
jgi:hypothetical protein